MSKGEPGSASQSEDADSASRASAKSLKHELRTPLNHIIGYCEMLLEEAEDKELEVLIGDLQRIHSAGQRLLKVINDLLKPSASDQMDESLLQHEVRTPLNQIIGYAEMLEEEAQDLDQQSLIPDCQKIQTAARNLLHLVLEKLVPMKRNSLQAEPKPDTSPTTFIRAGSDSSGEGPRERAEVARLSEPSYLLVVDDNELNRDMLVRRLERLGHRVEQAENGRQALEKLQGSEFDLVLLDILMPEMNGYQVLEHLSANPFMRNIPVIVLSASDDTASVARCVAMGAEDYLSKPFDPVLLQARITACLEKKRLRDQEASYLKQIEDGKRRSDELLEIILPHDVANELKATSAVQPRRYENVGVLFCDIAEFTAYCDQHSPEVVLTQLQSLVEEFELLTAQHGLEKIKTIGDSFMATAGLLTPMADPGLQCVRCGLSMAAAATLLPPHWQVRVGVHVGPVIAGVVGKRKYQYDVWGDTVNTAARMEQAAVRGAVCVNTETWESLRGRCRGRSQGVLEIKGKGRQELFHVEAVLE